MSLVVFVLSLQIFNLWDDRNLWWFKVFLWQFCILTLHVKQGSLWCYWSVVIPTHARYQSSFGWRRSPLSIAEYSATCLNYFSAVITCCVLLLWDLCQSCSEQSTIAMSGEKCVFLGNHFSLSSLTVHLFPFSVETFFYKFWFILYCLN